MLSWANELRLGPFSVTLLALCLLNCPPFNCYQNKLTVSSSRSRSISLQWLDFIVFPNLGKSCNMFWSVKYDRPFLKLGYTWTFVFCRMRDKGKQKAPPPKQAKPGFNRKERQRRQMEKPTQTRNQVKIYSVFLFISLGRLHKTLCVLRSSYGNLNDIRNYKKISRHILAPKKPPV